MSLTQAGEPSGLAIRQGLRITPHRFHEQQFRQLGEHGSRPWPAGGDLLRGVAECRVYPFRGAGLFDVKLEQRRQRRDDWIAFAAGAAEESANHPRNFAVAAMMDGCEAAVL